MFIFFMILAVGMFFATITSLRYQPPKNEAPSCPKCHEALPLFAVYFQMRAWPFKPQIYCGHCHRRLNITKSKGFWLQLFALQIGCILLFMLTILPLLIIIVTASGGSIFALFLCEAIFIMALIFWIRFVMLLVSRLIKKYAVFTEDI